MSRMRRSEAATPVWQPPAAGVAMAHQMLRDQMARRRGGTIGIGNKGAIALRFDHGANNFRDLVVPLLRKYNLPASQAYPTQMFTSESSTPQESNTSSWDEVREWALTAGVEPLAHSRTHRPADTLQALRDEIIVARAELADAVPESAIETWAVPGGGGTEYMGFNDGNAPDRFYDTTAGAMILSTYGFSMGHIPGSEWPLDGRAQIGAMHSTVDRADALRAARSKVRQIVENRTGYVVMLHPRFLTYGQGYTSTDDLERFLALIASLRDAGRLEVMTVGGLAHAQTGSRRRLNLVAGGDFPETWAAAFEGAETWTRLVDTSRGVPHAMVRSNAPGMLTQSISNWRATPHRGAVFEVIAHVRSPRGAAAQIGAPEKHGAIGEHEISEGNRWREIRQYVTIPLNSKDPFAVGVGPLDGTIDVKNFRVQPI